VRRQRLRRAQPPCPPTHYVAAEKCINCQQVITVTIPKGMQVKDYVVGIDCPNCGCPLAESYFYPDKKEAA